MSYDPTNPDESLPQDLDPSTVAEPAAAAPPPPPPPADPLFDQPGYAAAAPAAGRPARGEGVDKKTLIGAGVGAAVIALGAVFGINLASSSADDATNAAATGPMGMAQGGQSGQFPGGQSGTDGSTQQQGQMPGQPGGTGQAQGGVQGGPQGSTGTIEDIGDGTLTITTDDGQSVEVTTTDDTEVSISQSQSADDIDEGDTVMVIGQSSDGSSVTAERVVERSGDDAADQGGPGGGMGPTVGEVSSVDGDSFTLTTDSGDITVTLTDDTTVVVERQASVSDLSEGDEVFVHTETADDGSTWAERILAGDELPDFSAGPGGMSGGMPGGPTQGSSSGQSGTMAPPSQGGTSGTGSSSGTTGGAPGANAGPSGVTTT